MLAEIEKRQEDKTLFWYYKIMPKELSDGEGVEVDAPKHGPYSNQQMQSWKEAGYFEENDI